MELCYQNVTLSFSRKIAYQSLSCSDSFNVKLHSLLLIMVSRVSVLYSFCSCYLNEISIQEGPEEVRLHLQQTATRQARIVIVILEVDHRRGGRHEWSFADERAGQLLFAWIRTEFVVRSCRSSGWRALGHHLVFQVDGQRDRQTLR